MSRNANSLLHTIYISSLDVKLSQASRKRVKALKLQTSDTTKEFPITLSPGDIHKEEFESVLILPSGGHLSVSLECQTRFRDQVVIITMDHREILSGVRNEQGIQKYQKVARNVEVVITLHSLYPTTSEVIASCSRFRLLIIGNSGVGKSSLINKVFGVEGVQVSDDTRGEADINKEFISEQNERFVLHDSKGFEEGDENNVEVVKNFVGLRKDKPQLKHRLHAVWLCLQIPYADGRLLDAGVEEFLRRRNEILGNVPLVIVLTKLDLLDNQLELHMLADDSGDKTLEQHKSEFLEKACVGPLREVAGSGVPYVTVSVKDPYSQTCADLVDTTLNIMNTFIDEEARIVAAVAQRASIKVNVASSIAVGKKKYWTRLAESTFFSGHTLKECVQVLHSDIVTVWHFHDPDQLLQHDDVIGAVLRIDDLDQPEPASFTPSSNLLASSLANLLGSSPDPTMIIVTSVVGMGIWLGKLAYEMYSRSQRVMKLFMAYIVGLTFIMQVIFLLAPESRVTPQVIDLAVQTYEASKRQRVRHEIDKFNVKHGLLPGGPDYVLEEIERLIRLCSIGDHEINELREKIRALQDQS